MARHVSSQALVLTRRKAGLLASDAMRLVPRRAAGGNCFVSFGGFALAKDLRPA
jgi:hypothetical protein